MNISRRDFIRQMAAFGFSTALAGTVFSLLSCTSREKPITIPPPASSPPPTTPAVSPSPRPAGTGNYLAIARGQSPKAMVEAALKALGGMERFVKPGDDVIVKPNICVAHRSYEYAATTNPEVVAALVSLSLGAGAGRVRVMDSPFSGTAEQAYVTSGIADAVKAAGGEMEVMGRMKFREVDIPGGKDIARWPVYADALEADVLINVPIAKHHSLARLTIGMKNLMGLILNRGEFHFNLGQRLADLASLLRPMLTVVDAVRILKSHGPQGGSLSDVKMTNTIIASPDIVAADACAATLFDLAGADVSGIAEGDEMGLGTMDLSRIKVEEVTV